MALPSAHEFACAVSSTGKKRGRLWSLRCLPTARRCPFARGDLGTSRLKGGSSERYTSRGRLQRAAAVVRASDFGISTRDRSYSFFLFERSVTQITVCPPMLV